jgi:hypothetical protein
MNRCVPCGLGWASYSLFVRHMVREHGKDSPTVWRRINEARGGPVAAVRTRNGRWLLYVQDQLDM